MKMINRFNKLFILLFSLLPLLLITGPAIPDIIISISCLYFIILYFFIQKNKLLINHKIFLFSLIFWISLIFISFFSYEKYLSFQDSIIFIRLLFIPIVGYFFIFNYQKNLEFCIKIIFFVVCFVIIDSLFQFFNYSAEEGFGSDLLGFKSNWYGRLTGPFKNELIPGSFSVKLGFLGFIYFLITKQNKVNFLTAIFYLSLIGVLSFVSGERMALAMYMLCIGILFLFLKNLRMLILFSLTLFILLNLSIYKFHPFYNDFKIIESTQYHQGLKIEKEFKCSSDKDKKCKKIINVQPSFIEILRNFKTSAYGEIYSLGINMFKNNPLTGVGINNFKYVCLNFEKYNKQMKNYSCASHPHNLYIQWLAEGGIIVFMIFIVYLSYLFFFILKNNRNHTLKIISLTNLIILFWPIMSTGSLIKNWNGILTFFIIAVSVSLHKIKINNLK